MKERKTLILGGGTFQHIRNHLSLAAPAFGNTARYLHTEMPDSELVLTKMADPTSKLVTNDDVSKFIDSVLDDYSIGTLILNVAFCDYYATGNDPNDSHADRFETDKGPMDITLAPTEKVISKIRKYRPDIFLVGFKTTTGKDPNEQFLRALKMMKSVKCNLVFANDVVTRNNMVITAEETIYGESKDRNYSLDELVELIRLRSDLTYTPSNWIQDKSVSMQETPESFQKVIQWLSDEGGFIENNSNGFTPGHFCYRTGKNTFLSSQRKANHNKVFQEGMSKVSVSDDGKFTVIGERKASVGARSQWLMLEQNPGYDCIVHTHNPQALGSLVHTVSQKPYQCGSLECGTNTLNGLKDYELGNAEECKAVYLEKHGINLLFKSSTPSEEIIKFLRRNIVSWEKVR